MAVIGLRSGKVANGIYRQNAFRIEKSMFDFWDIFEGANVVAQKIRTLAEARNWCKRQNRLTH